MNKTREHLITFSGSDKGRYKIHGWLSIVVVRLLEVIW